MKKNNKDVDRLFDEVAQRPSAGLGFPTYLAPIIRIKDALKDPDLPFSEIVKLVRVEPVLSSKILVQANAASSSPLSPIRSLDSAIMRVGLAQVRRLSLMVAIEQINRSRVMLPYATFSKRLWLSSLYRSSALEIFTHAFTSRSPVEASIRGLLSLIGAFYLLYQYGTDLELCQYPGALKDAVARNYSEATNRILIAENLGTPVSVPKEIDGLYDTRFTEQALVVYSAILGDSKVPWAKHTHSSTLLPPEHAQLVTDIDHAYEKLKAGYEG